MNALTIVWMLAGVAAVSVAVVTLYTWRARRRAEIEGRRNGLTWKRAYHLGTSLASGRGNDRDASNLIDLIDDAADPFLVAAAIAVAVRQQPSDVDRAIYAATNRSALTSIVRKRLHDGDDANGVIEALEVIEVLHLDALLSEVATLARNNDPTIVRAACEALVELDPSIAIGVLVGLANRSDSWVLDSLGRAAHRLNADPAAQLPLSRQQWRSAPLLARRALTESAMFDPGTVTDALAALVGALEDPSTAKRLAAVNALTASIDHPAAQLALAGALGADERTVRYATAANLSTSVVGQRILRRAAEHADGSDAASMAAEILWSLEPIAPELTVLAS